MDIKNLKPLDCGSALRATHWEIRFSCLDPLTGSSRIMKRRWKGDLSSAQTERDRLRICVRTGIDPDSDRGLAVGGHPDYLSIPQKRGGVTGRPPRVARREGEVSLREMRDRYIERRKSRTGKRKKPLSPRTIARDETSLDDWILPEVGDILAQRLTPSVLEDLIDTWVEKRSVSPATINTHIRILRHFIGWVSKELSIYSAASDLEALPEDRRIKTSVQAEITGRKLDSKAAIPANKIGPLLEMLKSDYPGYYALAYISLYGGGLRWGSVSALQWGDVDENAGILIVQRSQDQGVVKEGSKTGHVSSVPLEPIREALEHHRQWQESTGHRGHKEAPPWIFAADYHALTGAPPKYGMIAHPSSFCKSLAKACAKVGLEPRTHHAFRNTFVSLAGASGASQAVLESMTGHVSEMTTHYTTTTAGDKLKLITSAQEVAQKALEREQEKEKEAERESQLDGLTGQQKEQWEKVLDGDLEGLASA